MCATQKLLQLSNSSTMIRRATPDDTEIVHHIVNEAYSKAKNGNLKSDCEAEIIVKQNVGRSLKLKQK